MPLTAVAPFLTPSADVPLAEEVLDVLGRVRFVSRSSLLAYAQPLGLDPACLDDWIAVGLVFQGRVRLDTLKPVETDYLALTPAGARELALRGRKAEGVSPSRLARSPGKRAHDTCVGEVALTAIQAERVGLTSLVGLQVDDPRFGTSVVLARTGLALKRVALHADLIFALREGDRRRAFLVEVDRGTISIVGNPLVRAIVTKSRPRIDARRLMDRGAIVIASLPRGRLGEEGTALLGGLLIGAFQQAALGRADVALSDRRPFFMLVDEAGVFATAGLLSILSEARKYAVGLVLATQSLAVLEPPVRTAILGNAGTLVSFRLGAEDAEIVSKEFVEEVEASHLQRLAIHECVVRSGGGRAVTLSDRVVA